MSSCVGCEHYQPLMEQCDPLVGKLWCQECHCQWAPKECNPDNGICCPGCLQLLASIDISLCEGGQPSAYCPGFVLKAASSGKPPMKPVKKKKPVKPSDEAQGMLF